MAILEIKRLVERAKKEQAPIELVQHCEQWYEPYYNLFYLCAQLMKGKGIAVELGVDQGRGSLAFVLGGVETFGIDHTRKEGIEKVEEYDNFTFLNTNTLPIPDHIEGKDIALLHIDTEHSYSMAQQEFVHYKEHLIDGAIVFFDDLHAAEDSVLEYFLTLPYQSLIADELHDPCGFGLIVYSKD